MYQNVWLLSDVPDNYGISKKDTGVDLVAEQKNGDLVAIQAKFYTHKVGKDAINSFVAELGKSYYQHGLIVSTVDEWNSNARETIEQNEKGIEIIGLSDLRNSQIDWSQFNFERPEKVTIKKPKQLRGYQQTAKENALNHFKEHDRGQLIMAPGTGKTFTSLKIAEALAKEQSTPFKVLYLVPSIQLLTQTLRGWNNDTELTMTSMAVTSDRDASRGTDGNEDIKASDIGYPATTSSQKILQNWRDFEEGQPTDMVVIFSTYQSIDVIGEAQKRVCRNLILSSLMKLTVQLVLTNLLKKLVFLPKCIATVTSKVLSACIKQRLQRYLVKVPRKMHKKKVFYWLLWTMKVSTGKSFFVWDLVKLCHMVS